MITRGRDDQPRKKSDSDYMSGGPDTNRSDATSSPELVIFRRVDTPDINALDNITDFESDPAIATENEVASNFVGDEDLDSNGNPFNDTDSIDHDNINGFSEDSFNDATSDVNDASALSDDNVDGDNIPFAPFTITVSDDLLEPLDTSTEATIKTSAEMMAADLDIDIKQLETLRESFESNQMDLGQPSNNLRRDSNPLHETATPEIDAISRKIERKYNTAVVEIEKTLPFLRSSSKSLEAPAVPPVYRLVSINNFSLQIISVLIGMSNYIAATLRTLPGDLSDENIQKHFSNHQYNARNLIEKNISELKALSEKLNPVIAEYKAFPPPAPSIEYNKVHV